MVHFRNNQYENTADLYDTVQVVWATIAADYLDKFYKIIAKRLFNLLKSDVGERNYSIFLKGMHSLNASFLISRYLSLCLFFNLKYNRIYYLKTWAVSNA